MHDSNDQGIATEQSVLATQVSSPQNMLLSHRQDLDADFNDMSVLQFPCCGQTYNTRNRPQRQSDLNERAHRRARCRDRERRASRNDI